MKNVEFMRKFFNHPVIIPVQFGFNQFWENTFYSYPHVESHDNHNMYRVGICHGNISDINITLTRYKWEITDNILYHASCFIINTCNRVIEKYRFYRFCRQKMWKSDKNNMNIGPDVRLKKNAMFKFFTDIRNRSA